MTQPEENKRADGAYDRPKHRTRPRDRYRKSTDRSRDDSKEHDRRGTQPPRSRRRRRHSERRRGGSRERSAMTSGATPEIASEMTSGASRTTPESPPMAPEAPEMAPAASEMKSEAARMTPAGPRIVADASQTASAASGATPEAARMTSIPGMTSEASRDSEAAKKLPANYAPSVQDNSRTPSSLRRRVGGASELARLPSRTAFQRRISG